MVHFHLARWSSRIHEFTVNESGVHFLSDDWSLEVISQVITTGNDLIKEKKGETKTTDLKNMNPIFIFFISSNSHTNRNRRGFFKPFVSSSVEAPSREKSLVLRTPLVVMSHPVQSEDNVRHLTRGLL